MPTRPTRRQRPVGSPTLNEQLRDYLVRQYQEQEERRTLTPLPIPDWWEPERWCSPQLLPDSTPLTPEEVFKILRKACCGNPEGRDWGNAPSREVLRRGNCVTWSITETMVEEITRDLNKVIAERGRGMPLKDPDSD